MASDFRDRLRNPHCDLCSLHQGADFICLMGSGPPRADVMIVGEAPGQREDEEHRAFVGKAGQLLDIALSEYAQIDRDTCYVTNTVKCRPPNNRTPARREAKACVEAYLWDEVAQIKPKFILLLGNSALQGVMKQSGITKKSGTVWSKVLGGVPVEVMATIHPAAVLRNPKNKDLFVSDIARFGRLVRGQKQESDTKVKIIRTTSQLKWLLHKLREVPVNSYDIETYVKPPEPPFVRTSFQDWHGRGSYIVSISFSWEEGQAAVVPIWHEKTPWKDPDRVLEALRPVLTRKKCKYVAHNGKFDARWLHSKGIPLRQTFDTMLAAHMLEENRPKGLKPLSRTLLGVDAYDVGEDLGAAHKMPLRKLCIYNGKDTDYTLRLYRKFREQLKEDPRAARVFLKLMMPASNALVDIERYGVWIDPERWQERHDQAQENVSKLYRYINKFVSPALRPINLRSPPQVAKWLYEDLDLPVIETTDSGGRSTREGVILQLMFEHDNPGLKALLKYRKWAKYLSTYLLPWWYEHKDKRGRIHSNYKLFGTVTGRLSGEGGIQQVPRDPFIRSIIGAPPGWAFVQADYCLSKGTLVETLKGPQPIEKVAVGTPVYSWYKGKIRWQRVKKRAFVGRLPCVEVTLDNGKSFTASYDHDMLLRDGTRVTAAKLRKGDRLAAIRKSYSGQDRPTVYSKKAFGDYRYVHDLVAEAYLGAKPKGYDVHHIDGNPRNNTPSNLEYKESGLHKSLHAFKTVNEETRLRELRKALKNRRDYSGSGNPNYGNRGGTDRICPNCGNVFYDNLRAPSKTAVKRQRKPRKFCGQQCYFESRRTNHRVLSVRKVGIKPVYALEVEEDHNFALSCGVISGNSQIELRIAAMIAKEQHMLRQYMMGEDIHMGRAVKMTKKQAKDVSKEERKKAKAVNFGFLYGMGPKKFVTYAFENYDVRVTGDEAQVVRDGFFEDYPGLKTWHDRQRRLARRYGMVYSPIGRARHLPDIMSADKDVQAEAERQAINSPVQSMASDMMLFSLIRLHNKILDPKEARIVGTVHDSLLFEVREDCVDEYCAAIKDTMEDVPAVERTFGCDITVPIIADLEYGDHWSEGTPWEKEIK